MNKDCRAMPKRLHFGQVQVPAGQREAQQRNKEAYKCVEAWRGWKVGSRSGCRWHAGTFFPCLRPAGFIPGTLEVFSLNSARKKKHRYFRHWGFPSGSRVPNHIFFHDPLRASSAEGTAGKVKKTRGVTEKKKKIAPGQQHLAV
jgi:hypothetical protein